MINKNGVETRKRLFDAIVSYIKKHDYPPTVRELCEMTGIKSTNTVHYQLKKLMDEGVIETDHGLGSARAIRVVKKENGTT